MNPRIEAAKQIMSTPEYCTQFNHNQFSVRSDSVHYIVSKVKNRLVCKCDDHQIKKSDCKHIKVVRNVIRRNQGYKNNIFHILELANGTLKNIHGILCKYCDSGDITKKGFRKNKSENVQIFYCKECGRRFTANFGFERMRFKDYIITRSLQMYFTGMSYRDITGCHEQEGTHMSHKTVGNWVKKYSIMISKYIQGIVPRVGNWFRADEIWIKIKGKKHYLFVCMDDDTRYMITSELANSKEKHNAENLFRMAKEITGKSPTVLITDKLPSYKKACKKIFGSKTYHKADAGIKSKRRGTNGRITNANYHPSNNKMERLNGEIRDREKVFRGLKKPDTPILDGMRIYYNFTKKHISLDGRTPAQAALIEVEGIDKWKTLIQNASLNTA